MHNYFDGDKSLIIVPQSKCILRQGFEEGNEVEVSWKNKKRAKQICSGVVVKIASKEYLTAFCMQNEKAYPNSKEVNLAFRQQITYARVKTGRKAKIVDMTGL